MQQTNEGWGCELYHELVGEEAQVRLDAPHRLSMLSYAGARRAQGGSRSSSCAVSLPPAYAALAPPPLHGGVRPRRQMCSLAAFPCHRLALEACSARYSHPA